MAARIFGDGAGATDLPDIAFAQVPERIVRTI